MGEVIGVVVIILAVVAAVAWAATRGEAWVDDYDEARWPWPTPPDHEETPRV